MTNPIISWINGVKDRAVSMALQAVSRGFDEHDARIAKLEQTALKTGSPVNAYAQRVTNVAEPVRNSDAVTLGYFRRQVAILKAPAPAARPTGDAGGEPAFPPPTGTFTATPLTLGAPGNVTGTWTSENATSAEISGIGAVALSGSATRLISTSTIVTLTLRGRGGTTTYTVTITVTATPAPTPSPTGTFQAIPSTPIAQGASATLSWTSANATAAELNQGIGAVALSGTRSVSPVQTTAYELRLTGAGGTTILTTTVTVNGPTTPVPPPNPVPGSYVAGVLGYGFSNNGVRFPWKGFSAFTAMWFAVRPDAAYVARDTLRYFKNNGCTVPRIILTITDRDTVNGFWVSKGYRIYPPEHDNYFTALKGIIDFCNSLGMMPELVIFGDASTGGYGTQSARIAFTEQVARELLPYRGLFIEIANEFSQIHFENAQQVYDLGQAYRAIDPDRIMTLSSPDPGQSYFQRPPSNYVTTHPSRGQTPRRDQWIVDHYVEQTMAQKSYPAVSDEPMNAGYALYGVYEEESQYWWALAALGRMLGWSTTFHYEGGLFMQKPAPRSAEEHCLEAWKAGYDFADPDQGVLCIATPTGIFTGPCPWPTSGGNLAVLGRSVNGTCRAFTFGTSALPAAPGYTVQEIPLGYSAYKAYIATPTGL